MRYYIKIEADRYDSGESVYYENHSFSVSTKSGNSEWSFESSLASPFFIAIIFRSGNTYGMHEIIGPLELSEAEELKATLLMGEYNSEELEKTIRKILGKSWYYLVWDGIQEDLENVVIFN